ncbi:sigma factor [Micromonospora sp. NPDC049366]|uniref:sigma factor n=1 Tax=Micromonospora sp. NPDC049366 TaxID=3364271 RepID=UPI003797F3BD
MRRFTGHREVPGEALVRQLWLEHGRAMLAYAAQLTRDRADAEDIVQEALVRAGRQTDDLPEDRVTARVWLLTLVRHVASVDEHAEQAVDPVAVAERLRRLAPGHRVVVDLLYLRGYSVLDAAAALGLPPDSIRSQAYHALRALRGTQPELPLHPPSTRDRRSTVRRPAHRRSGRRTGQR